MTRFLARLALIVLVATAGRAALAGEVTPLVDAAWLKANAGSPGVVVLDVRNKLGGGSEADYRQGHVPGAVYSDYLRAGWRATVDGVPGQLPPVGDLERLIGGLGIGNDDHVVVVTGGASALDMGSATRVYWTFKVLGHDKVSVLDGGWRAYAADPANPVETGANTPAPKTFVAQFRPELIADHADVMAADRTKVALLDLRPPVQYRGEKAHPAAARPGTIPDAVNVPESQVTTDGGRFVSAEQLGELLDAAGVSEDDEVISFCNTGHWASLGWFVRSEILGKDNVTLYDGSMVDWTARSELPVQHKTAQ